MAGNDVMIVSGMEKYKDNSARSLTFGRSLEECLWLPLAALLVIRFIYAGNFQKLLPQS